MLDQRDLMGDLEGIRRIVGARVQRQHAADGIVAAHRIALPAHDDADAMLLLDRIGHLAHAVARAFAHAARQLFGGDVQFVDIVVDIMEEVAHLFIRRRLGGGGAGNRVVEFGELFPARRSARCMERKACATSGALWMTSFRSCTEGWRRKTADRQRPRRDRQSAGRCRHSTGWQCRARIASERQKHRGGHMPLVRFQLR